ncbi:MAG TPA: hypothetical protein VFR88_10900, partial [Microlunatus sp.]|nr:hypothetical protein [Microlunatus sp.]
MADATVSSTELLERGRVACRRRVWSDAVACLTAADRSSPLAAGDLDLLAVAMRLTGRDADADDCAARSYQA